MASQSKTITFQNARGQTLAAKIDRPAQTPRAYAIFAHCFTCSKDLFAARAIAAALCAHDIAVFRFDFTGSGFSEGTFADTNFSTNVDDLVAAAQALRDNFSAPTILIGHSLGGAAVLAATQRIAEIKAVATIGAPADAAHVVHNLGASLEDIGAQGQAEVRLGRRTFTIKKQFVDDVEGQTLKEAIASLDAALLVLHAPLDDIVGIDNAAQIFSAAKHPKSFISLDTADHLISRHEDATYVADVIASWASRYVPEQKAPKARGEGQVVVAESGVGRFHNTVRAGAHHLVADEPADVGGGNAGPSPYDYLAIALGACTSMTLRMYANRKKLPLDHVSVAVDHEKVHARDCEACIEAGRSEGRVDRFMRRLHIEGVLDEKTRARMLQIADMCPVHKTLEQSSVITTKLEDPTQMS